MRYFQPRIVAAFFLSVLVVFLLGCKSRESTVIVGKVQSLSGRPLADVALSMGPESGRPIATAVTDSSGSYELSGSLAKVQQTLMISARKDGFKPWRALITSGGRSTLIVNLADTMDPRESTCSIRAGSSR